MKTPSDFLQWLSTRESGKLMLTDEIEFDVYENLKAVERIKAGTYKSATFPDGMRKFAYSLGHILHFTLYRFSDKDAKELELVANTDEGLKHITFFKAMLRGYLNDANYDTVMNSDRSRLIDGHLMTKDVNNKSYPVTLLNVIRDWSNKNLEDDGLAEKTFPTMAYFDEIAETLDEKDKKQLENIRQTATATNGTMCVHEWWNEDKLKEDDEYATKVCIRYLDSRTYQPTDNKTGIADWMPFIELERFKSPATRVTVDEDELDYYKKRRQLESGNRVPAYPYKEQRFFELDRCALGIGVWLAIKDIIEHTNESWNEKRRFDKVANKGTNVYTRNSKDRSITQEVLNQLDTGGVIEIKQGEKFDRLNLGTITPDHLATVDRLFDLARQRLGIQPSAVIEPNASQSATAAAYENENAKSTYAIIGELLNLYYQELFRDFKIPSIIKHLKKKQNLKLMGTRAEMDEIDDTLSTNLMNAGLKQSPNKDVFNASTLAPEEESMIKGAIKTLNKREGNMRIVGKLGKEVFDLFGYDIMFYSGSTGFDKRERTQLYNELIMEARSNPNSKYSSDKIMDAKLDLFDVNPKRFEKSPEEIRREQEIIAQAQQAQQQQMSKLPNTSVV